MNSILHLPLPTRCDTIARLVNECTNKELENFFPLLIDDLFGITNQVGWRLRQIKFNSDPAEFDLLCKFLHPNGPVFKLCYKLLADCHLKYDFPLTYLPLKVKNMIAEGMVPSFYADKLQVDGKSRIPLGLALNPFELFMFHFMYHLVNPNIQTASDSNQWVQWDLLYIRLVEEYLNTFLPCNSSVVQPPAHFFVQSPPRPHNVHFSPSRPLRSPTLLKQSVIMNQSSSVQHNSLYTSVQAVPTLELWRSELIAQLCIDFWLSTSSYDSQSCNYSSNHFPLWAQPKYDMKFNQNFTGPVWTQQYLPTGEHVRVVRFMVKHLHSFANSLIEDSSAMDELKRVIIPSCQGKLYSFIRYTMQHWPLDTSFRYVLETWLSYIQPWRYHVAFRKSKEVDDKSPICVDSHWMQFIAENLLAYSLIFNQLLLRFSRIDLATPKNAFMLYRVTKVFSLGNLTEYLRNIEAVLEEGTAKPICSKWAGLVRQHLVDLEGPCFQYQPMFGPGTKAAVIRFQGQIQQALVTAQTRLDTESANKTSGFWRWFSMPSFSSEYSIDERKRVIINLTTSLNGLRNIFQFDGSESQNNCSVMDSKSSISSNSTLQQSFMIYDCRRNIKYEGDPDLQPIRSFENAFLVRVLYHLSVWVNTNYENEIQQMYRRDDWIGGVMRQILLGPQTIHTYTASGPDGYSPRVSSLLPPRISFRHWAHHRTITFLLIVFLFFFFYGFPISIVVLLACFMWFLLLFLRYLCGRAPKPPRCSSFNSSF